MYEEMKRGTTEGSAYDGLAQALREVIAASGRRVTVIGSIDGSHVGPRFQHPDKVDRKMQKQIAALDSLAWQFTADGEPDSFFKMFLSNHNAQNFDGVGVLYLMMRLFAGRAKASVLKYAQWFEPRDTSVVTLASAAFRPVPATA
jgi:predicted class III extradiol MEMO1 family dioxygenase